MSPVLEAPEARPADPALGHDAGKMPALPPARTPALQAGPARPASPSPPQARNSTSNSSLVTHNSPTPSNPQSEIRNPQSLWLSLTGLLPGLLLAPDRRRAGLQALTQWVLDHLQAHVQAATAALARELTFPLSFPPEPGSPFFEPSFALAAELGLPESKLNQFLREVSGLTARETWDYLRVSEALWNRLRRDIRLLLGSQPLVPTGRDGTGPEHFLKMLRAARREKGWTAQVRAWRLGYRNAARLNQAVWAATGRSLSEMEAEVLYEECLDWQRVRAGVAQAPSPVPAEPPVPSPISGEGRDERRESGEGRTRAAPCATFFSARRHALQSAFRNPQSEIRRSATAGGSHPAHRGARRPQRPLPLRLGPEVQEMLRTAR